METGESWEEIVNTSAKALRWTDNTQDQEKYCDPGNRNVIRNAMILAIRWFAIDDKKVGQLVSKMRDFHHAQYTAKDYQECASIIRSVLNKLDL